MLSAPVGLLPFEHAQKTHLGRRLKLCRIERNMNLTELEKRSGIDRSILSKIERNEVRLRLADFIAICMVLGANPVVLLCGSENWNPKEVTL